MRILLDNCVNHRFAGHLTQWDVVHARELGWASLSNGNLINAAIEANFDVLLTVDKNIRKQKDISKVKLNLITLNAYSILLEDLQHFVELIDSSLGSLSSSGAKGQDIFLSL